MSIGKAMLAEFDMEMTTTRKTLERVPGEKGAWKPHEKSFSLGHLAQLVARMPGWLTLMLGNTEMDLGGGPGYSLETTETLLRVFDENVREARHALEQVGDADLAVTWSLKMGGNVVMALPRKVVVRQTINHLVHHRGQLSVYLRLLDVPVPSMYGPTADEPWGS